MLLCSKSLQVEICVCRVRAKTEAGAWSSTLTGVTTVSATKAGMGTDVNVGKLFLYSPMCISRFVHEGR